MYAANGSTLNRVHFILQIALRWIILQVRGSPLRKSARLSIKPTVKGRLGKSRFYGDLNMKMYVLL